MAQALRRPEGGRPHTNPARRESVPPLLDRSGFMYYDDQARRFNFVSGLLCGTVLGVGLALTLVPQKRVPRAGPLRRARRRVDGGLERLAGGVAGAVSAGRERLGA